MPPISQPAIGVQPKTLMRMEQVARLRVTGRLTDARIAGYVGLTPAALSQMVQRPEYKEIEEALYEGRITELDRQIADDDEALREVAKVAVPAALRTLVECVTQRRDLRVALAASKEILDRDPSKRLQAPRATSDGHADGRPQLPGDVIAYMTLRGNEVAAEIRMAPRATGADEPKAPPPHVHTEGGTA